MLVEVFPFRMLVEVFPFKKLVEVSQFKKLVEVSHFRMLVEGLVIVGMKFEMIEIFFASLKPTEPARPAVSPAGHHHSKKSSSKSAVAKAKVSFWLFCGFFLVNSSYREIFFPCPFCHLWIIAAKCNVCWFILQSSRSRRDTKKPKAGIKKKSRATIKGRATTGKKAPSRRRRWFLFFAL